MQGVRRRGDGAARRAGVVGATACARRGGGAVEDGKTVVHRVEQAKAEQLSRPAYKPPPDHPWRRPFKPAAASVAAGGG